MNVSTATPIGTGETLLGEWTVVGKANKVTLLQLAASLTILNTTGGINGPSDAVLTLRSGGTAGGVDGTLVFETPPVVVAQAQNAQATMSQPFTWLWTPTTDGALRWSLTGRSPSVKNTVTLRMILGAALTFA